MESLALSRDHPPPLAYYHAPENLRFHTMPNRFDLKYYGFGPATSGSCSSLVNPFILIPLYIISEAYLIDPNRLPKFSILDFINSKESRQG